MRVPRWFPLVVALPTVVLGGISVWAVGIESRRAERALLTEFQVLAERELELWRGAYEILKPVPIIVPEAAFASQWFPSVESPGAGERAHWGRYYEDLEMARSALGDGRQDEAGRLLAELRDDPAIANVKTSSGVPLLAVVLRAMLDVEFSTDPQHGFKSRIAQELCEHAFTEPSPLSVRLIEDATKFITDDPRWQGKEEVFDLLGGAVPGYSSFPGGEDFWGEELPCECAEFWSREFPWTVDRGKAWFADFSLGGGMVGIEPFEDIESQLRDYRAQVGVPEGVAVRYKWRGHTIQGPAIVPDESLAVASDGTLEIFVFPTDTFTWKLPIRDRVEKMAWRLGGVTIVVAIASWIAWWIYRKQARLAELESNFISSVSHELRTPVAAIGVLAERLESGSVKSQEEVEQYHGFIAREGRRLAALIDNVLDFSRIERRQKIYEFDAIDYRRLVGETVALLRPYAEEKGLVVEEQIDLPQDVELPEADAVAIRQVLVNLLDNAIKFTPEGGSVIVSLRASEEGDVTLAVSDTGPGVPNSERKNIFDRFYRADNGMTRETTGAGIGLSIVKHIVEAHGGTVTVASREGGGAVFEVTLKRKKDDVQ